MPTADPQQEDLAMPRSHKPTADPSRADPAPPETNPGDDAPPGTPGTGENVCPDCGGTGKLGGKDCQCCGGTGKVVTGVGGA
jgi:hypothetical protein